MSELLQAHLFLSQALTQDNLTALALLTVWLDPLWIGVSDPNELDPAYQDYAEQDDPKLQALLIARHCLPQVYVEAISHLHDGCTASELEDVLLAGFRRAGIPLDEAGLEMIWWGIPMPAYGRNLEEEEFFSDFPQTIPLLRLFGFTITDEAESAFDNPPDMEAACDIAIVLHESLEPYIGQSECQRQVYHALGWLWSISGNSSIDMDYESMSEYEPLGWSKENIEFAHELIAEAESILTDAMAGLSYLENHPVALDLLAQHIKTIRKHYQPIAKKGAFVPNDQLRQLTQRLDLDWSALAGGAL
jgi:hypothetical protein